MLLGIARGEECLAFRAGNLIWVSFEESVLYWTGLSVFNQGSYSYLSTMPLCVRRVAGYFLNSDIVLHNKCLLELVTLPEDNTVHNSLVVVLQCINK